MPVFAENLHHPGVHAIPLATLVPADTVLLAEAIPEIDALGWAFHLFHC